MPISTKNETPSLRYHENEGYSNSIFLHETSVQLQDVCKELTQVRDVFSSYEDSTIRQIKNSLSALNKIIPYINDLSPKIKHVSDLLYPVHLNDYENNAEFQANGNLLGKEDIDNTTQSNKRKGSASESTKNSAVNGDKKLKVSEKSPPQSTCDKSTETESDQTPVNNTKNSKEVNTFKLHPHDVLCGRGNVINAHAGNIFFRDMIGLRKEEYGQVSQQYQRKVATIIYNDVKNLDPPGRFLVSDDSVRLQNKTDSNWVEISEEKAIKKILQALRENDSSYMEVLSLPGPSTNVPYPSTSAASNGFHKAK